MPKPPTLRYLFPTLVTLPFHYPSPSCSRARFTLAAWCRTRLSSLPPASMHEAPEVAPPYLQASAAGGPSATHPGCLNLRDHCTGQWGPGPWRGLTEKGGDRAHAVSLTGFPQWCVPACPSGGAARWYAHTFFHYPPLPRRALLHRVPPPVLLLLTRSLNRLLLLPFLYHYYYLLSAGPRWRKRHQHLFNKLASYG